MALTAQEGAHCVSLTLDGHPIEVEFEYEPGEPGRLTGPPEDCYPAEPEVIGLLGVHVNGHWVAADLFSDEQQLAWVAAIKRLREEACASAAAAAAEDAIAAAREWR